MVAERLLRLRRHQEVAGHHVAALVQELVEGMLAVGARLAPDDRTGRLAHRLPGPRHPLAVGFPVALLQVGREALEALVGGPPRGRKSVVWGKGGSVRVDVGWGR